MKIKYLIVVLAICFCSVKASTLLPAIITVSELRRPLNLYGDQDLICSIDDNDSQLQVNEGKVNNNKYIVRPCELKDIPCVRSFLQDNSRCYIKNGPAPDPLCLPQLTLKFPFSNMTLTLKNLRMTGMENTEIIEFYYNKKTRNLVLAMDMKAVNQTSLKSYFSYHRTAKESVILADYISIFFDSFTLTAVIPMAPDLRLEMAEVHAYLPNGNPPIEVGPKVHESSDPQVAAAFADYKDNFPIILCEAFVFQSQLFAAIYIQTFLCDFGLQLYSF